MSLFSLPGASRHSRPSRMPLPPRVTHVPRAPRLDVARVDAVRDIGDALERLGLEPEIVVNNAGYALLERPTSSTARTSLR